MRALFLAAIVAFGGTAPAPQAPAVVGLTNTAEIQAAIAKLGSFEFAARTEAARGLRRARPETVIPLLAAAARQHDDEYARYRALTLLAGFGGPVAAQAMNDLKADRNDRIRMVVFGWYEHHPDPAILPVLIESYAQERSEFVRPALTRAIAAQSKDPRSRAVLGPLVLRGEDFFRGSVIDALGHYGGAFALTDILSVARVEGPLQDDAITAIGRIGDRSQVGALAALQRTAPTTVQPTISASLCLLGQACAETEAYLVKAVAFAARAETEQPLLRGAVHALSMLALRGNAPALKAMMDAGIAAKANAAKSPVALGVGLVALRRPELVINALESRPDADAAIDLLRDAFDMLSEDLEEELFFVAVQKAYWSAPADSARRRVTAAIITRLEF